MGLLRSAKRAVAASLKRTGAFWLASCTPWRRRRLLVLCYHGISIADEHEWSPALYLDQRRFERRMNILRRGRYSVLPLGDAVRALYAGQLPERAVAITFDDGAHDFYSRARPVLEAHGFPATVYLTTYYCGYNRPVFDGACSYMLWKERGKRAQFRGHPLDLAGSGRASALRQLSALATGLSGADRDAFLAELARDIGFDYESFVGRRILHIMNPAEVTDSAQRGIDFQLHTHRHRLPRDRALFRSEIDENRQSILAMTGRLPSHFCYPSNAQAPEFPAWLSELSVQTAVTCDPGLASSASDPLRLPRFLDSSNPTDAEFESWLAGVAVFLPSSSARRNAL
jgi:peptidoglycan/xylan/chitin deacetylase (PgdA/CDA1 family)